MINHLPVMYQSFQKEPLENPPRPLSSIVTVLATGNIVFEKEIIIKAVVVIISLEKTPIHDN